MQLTTHTDYSLRLLIYLMARAPQKATTREVAAAYGISLHHLTKVAKSLTKAGWLVAARGGGGGLTLAGHTPDARVGEIVRHAEFTRNIAVCFDPSRNGCPIAGVCCLKSVLYQARRAFFDVLDAVSIRDIARNSEELNPILGLPQTTTTHRRR